MVSEFVAKLLKYRILLKDILTFLGLEEKIFLNQQKTFADESLVCKKSYYFEAFCAITQN